ncbi:MAG: hypothetical protein QOE23_3441 [Pseudonocardiales bacterium]|nr:hypothetical protein [Pseudonocardiales bacterium]
MSSISGSVTLVAMPRSAETFLVRDAAGTLWLCPPDGAGESLAVDESAIEEAVRRHDWDRIEATFDTWEALDADLQRRAAELAPGRDIGIADYDAVDVRRILDGARAVSQAGDHGAARTMLHRLLREVTLVREDGELFEAITGLLVELDSASRRPPQRGVAGIRPEHRERARRLDLVAA